MMVALNLNYCMIKEIVCVEQYLEIGADIVSLGTEMIQDDEASEDSSSL